MESIGAAAVAAWRTDAERAHLSLRVEGSRPRQTAISRQSVLLYGPSRRIDCQSRSKPHVADPAAAQQQQQSEVVDTAMMTDNPVIKLMD